ncbi:MAG: hypothetical protein NZ518_00140 [Dehalococcoidia bacterium]|nr:hypothetical protein [Dehalococcoidia bacterium]
MSRLLILAVVGALTITGCAGEPPRFVQPFLATATPTPVDTPPAPPTPTIAVGRGPTVTATPVITAAPPITTPTSSVAVPTTTPIRTPTPSGAMTPGPVTTPGTPGALPTPTATSPRPGVTATATVTGGGQAGLFATATAIVRDLTATAQPLRSSPTPVRTPTPTPAVDLRQVDWLRVLTNETAFSARTDLDRGPVRTQGPLVRFPPNLAGGWAAFEQTIYGDISGDGREEAVIPLLSGGTAGVVGYLVYFAGDREPVYATNLQGYQMAARIEGGLLVVTDPVTAGWEPNCCPSGYSETRYRLVGATLVQVDRVDTGWPEMLGPTVEEFYALLNRGDYRGAYRFLTPEAQALTPYDRWLPTVQGWSNIAVSITGQNAASATVTVTLTFTERAGPTPVTRRQTGTWTLAWNSAARQWLLAESQLTDQR